MVDVQQVQEETNQLAVVAVRVRVPGAASPAAFWANLAGGVESITHFTDDELVAAGVPRTTLADPHYVRARGILDGIELFDAPFFGFTPRDAALADPQQRLFLHAAWELLETAGYDARTWGGRIGVYSSASLSSYLLRNLLGDPATAREGGLRLMIAAAGDHIPGQLSHKLHLTGPSIHVGTACSSSLTAVALACQGLRTYQCDMAIAGGVSIMVPQRAGYVFHEGGTVSADGHCRAFDARADGAVPGNGLGLVLLKRLGDALKDGDHIHAVIRGVALNNEGAARAGYTAPGVGGQADAIVEALEEAAVHPETIGYVEAHGSGTALGDPIEIEALTRAFRLYSTRRRFCAIGSVKTNVGHLDAAAGVVALIKAVLAVEHGRIPPSLHFVRPNPHIDFDASPFYVSTALADWPQTGPRRAGVTSLGISGTNVHVVLEEAPARPASRPSSRPKLLCVSAKTGDALAASTARLGAFLEQQPDASLDDVAYTLQVGRRAFAHKACAVCDDGTDAREVLAGGAAGRLLTSVRETGSAAAAFMFSGLGSQYVGMGRDLYETEPVFREAIDRCAALAAPQLGVNLRDVLYPPVSTARKSRSVRSRTGGRMLRRPGPDVVRDPFGGTRLSHPAIFAFEYALASVLVSWGIRPAALIGHSIGEYVAACVAGVLPVEDALRIVTGRAALIELLPPGAMLAVPLSEEETRNRLGDGLSVAAVNAPSMCLVAGAGERVAELEAALAGDGIASRRLPATHAFHSPRLAAVHDGFLRLFEGVSLQRPSIPLVSTATGDWIDESLCDPEYWFAHTCDTVRFADGVRSLHARMPGPLIEVGAGRELAGFARMQLLSDGIDDVEVVPSAGQESDAEADGVWLTEAVGRLWLAGVPVDWPGFHDGEPRQRIALPTYPFDLKPYWIAPAAERPEPAAAAAPVERGTALLAPQWKRSPVAPAAATGTGRTVLLVTGDAGPGQALGEALARAGARVVRARAADAFRSGAEDVYDIDASRAADYRRLMDALRTASALPDLVVHAMAVGPSQDEPAPSLSMLSLLHAVQAMAETDDMPPVHVCVITERLYAISGDEAVDPIRALPAAVCRVLHQEYEGFTGRTIDVPRNADEGAAVPADGLAAEILSSSTDGVVALRGRARYVRVFEPLAGEPWANRAVRLRDGGVYLITGGLGGVGLAIAEHLARRVRARLVLVSRQDAAAHGVGDRLRAIEALGSDVLVLQGDVCDQAAMARVRSAARARFGAVHGVVHAVTPLSGGLMQGLTADRLRADLAPKTIGAPIVDDTFADDDLDFLLLCSSLASVHGGAGSLAYTAANAFLDAYAQRRAPERPIVSVNWDRWEDTGIAVAGVQHYRSLTGREPLPGLPVAEAVAAFDRVLALDGLPQVAVTGASLEAHEAEADGYQLAPAGPRTVHDRPALATPFVAADSAAEQRIATVWRELFGIERLGVNDDFFALGGNSLLATQAAARIGREFSTRLSVRVLFEHATIRRLADAIGKRTAASSSGDPGPGAVVLTGDPPLSFGQTRLWFLDQLTPGLAHYNIPIALRIRGPLDAAALRRALDTVARRHETLRSRIRTDDGRPHLVIDETPLAAPELLDVSGVDEGDRASWLSAQAAEAARRPFDLAAGHPFRSTIVRFAADDHALLVTLHHIAADGWSVGVLLREVQALYAAYAADIPPALPALPVRYAQFAAWQQQQAMALDAQMAYWKTQLADAPALLALPTDRPRPAVQSFRGGVRACTIDEALAAQLERVAHEAGATLFMTLLAAFTVLLGRYSGEEDVLVGSPVANRPSRDLEPLIGAFVNTLVFRTDLSGAPTFLDLLDRTRRTCLDAYSNQDVPFERLVDELNPGRHTDRHPLVQVVLALQDRRFSGLTLPGLGIEPIAFDVDAARLDLEVHITETDAGLHCAFGYSADLFDPSTIDRMMRQFVTLLGAIAQTPAAPIADLPLLTTEEVADLLARLDCVPATLAPDVRIHEVVDEAARRDPDRTALVEVTDVAESVFAVRAGDPDEAQVAAVRPLCLRENPYVFAYGAEAVRAAGLAAGGAGDLTLVRTNRGNYAAVNGAVAALLAHLDGTRTLGDLYEAVQAGPRRLQLLELTVNRDTGGFDVIEHVWEPPAGIAAFVRLGCALYATGLAVPAGVRPGAADHLAIDWTATRLRPASAAPAAAPVAPCRPAARAPVLLLGGTAGTGSIGLAYLASYLRRHGIEAYCQLNDLHADLDSMRQNVHDLLERVHPKLVGISLKWFPHIARALEICRTVKAFDPQIQTVLGGDTATYFREDLLAEPGVDAVIAGDGEEPLLRLVAGDGEVPNFHARPGAALQQVAGGGPAYVQSTANEGESYLSHLDEIFVSRADPYLTGSFFMSAGRGCSANCFYCAGARENQRRVFGRPKAYMRSAEAIRNDLVRAKEYASTFLFDFDLPGINFLDRYRAIWESVDLHDHFAEFYFWKLPSIDFIDLVAATFKYVHLNIDLTSLSERHRLLLTSQMARMGVKPQPTDASLLAFFDACARHANVNTGINLINGLPHLTEADMAASTRMLTHIMGRFPSFQTLSWGRLHAQPGAPITLDPARYGMKAAATTYAEYLETSRRNLEEPSYPEVGTLHYPLIYFENETLNAQVSGHYADSSARVDRLRETRERTRLGTRRISYGELAARSTALAARLRALGAARETRVGVFMERSADLVVALLAVLKAGAAYVPLDPAYPSERIAAMLNDSAIDLVITRAADADRLPPAVRARTVVLIEQTPPAATDGGRLPAVGADDLAYVIYTSGSTGTPKGVLVSHRGLTNLARAQAETFQVSDDARVLQFASPSFDASISEIFMALTTGATLCLAHRDAMAPGVPLAGLLQELGVSHVTLPPSALKVLPHDDLPALRTLIVAGEACPPGLLDYWTTTRRVVNAYGPTETTVCATMMDCTSLVGTPLPIGAPMAGVRVRVLDEHLNPAPVGVSGELYVGGPALARGYAGRPGATAGRFVADPFSSAGERLYRTGDRVRLRADGQLEFLGRTDRQLKVRGFRVEPGEIEAALLGHADVQDAAVVLRENTQQELVLAAFVVAPPRPGFDEALREHLRATLPAYLVPGRIVRLDRMPLNASGKIDRRALPALEAPTGAASAAPRTPQEATLVEIWKSVLHLDEVGVHDNFFELDGDSIKSIQVVARANDAGLAIRPQDVFRHQTVAALAQVAGERQRPAARHGGVADGVLLLTPAQRWFLDRPHDEPHHFNMSLRLRLAPDAGIPALRQAVAAIVRHHDALRSRFRLEHGTWRQTVAANEPRDLLQVVDGSVIAPEARAAALEARVAEIQRSLDLSNGPVMRAAVIDEGDGRRDLLLVAHHLVVDGVSWRILLDDLATAYGQAVSGREVVLPAPTLSAWAWARQTASRADGRAGDAPDEAPLPIDREQPDATNTIADSAIVSVALDPDTTKALAQSVPTGYRVGVDVVLLAALARAVARWSGQTGVAIDVEGHGRDEAPALDVSRTVGWLTAIRPVVVEAGGATPDRTLRHAKDGLRGQTGAVPAVAPKIAFNYLGRLDSVAGEPPFDGLSPLSPGPILSPSYVRTHLLDVNSFISDGVLSAEFTYCRSMHERETIARLADGFADEVRTLVRHCLTPGATGLTPADFPLADPGQADLDAIVGAAGADLQDIYPLTPVQQGMLFHSLYDETGADVYAVQQVLSLAGPLDAACLKRAAAVLLRRHDALRGAFHTRGTGDPLQVVRRDPPAPWRDEDLSALPPEDREGALTQLLDADRRQRFDPTRAPLLRWMLVRLEPARHALVLTVHHALLDGWSGPILFDELLRLYEQGGDAGTLPPAPAYGAYLHWLARQDHAAADAWWSRYLAGVEAGTLLADGTPPAGEAAGGPAELRLELSAEETAAVERCARTSGVTAGTLVQAIWGVLLARLGSRRDVVFGVTVATRPPDLPGIERAVGPYINTVPVRLQVPRPEEPLASLAGRLQRELTEQMPHRHAGLTAIRRACGLLQAGELFDTLVVYENYPADASTLLRRYGSIELTDVQGRDATHYPLTLMAHPGPRWTFRLLYAPDRFDRRQVQDLGDRFVRLLRQAAEAPATPVAQLTLVDPDERRRLTREWNETRSPLPEVTVPALVEAQAARTPDAVAVVGEDGTAMTYAALNARANRVARALIATGRVGPERVVGLALRPSIDAIVALLAVLKAGGAYLPLDLSHPLRRLAQLLEDASAGAIVGTRDAREVLPAGAPLIALDDPDVAAQLTGFSPDNVSDAERLEPLVCDHPAYVMFTSGSTGTPKGVVVPHAGIANQIGWMTRTYPLTTSDAVIQKTALTFDVSAWEILWPLASGATLVVAREDGRADPVYLSELIERHGVTAVHFVPSALDACLDAFERVPPARRVCHVFTSGEALGADAPARVAAALGDACHNLYGPTEAAVHATAWDCEAIGDRRTPPIGRPVANMRAYVLDDCLEPLPAGTTGELYLAGVGLARGYAGRPGLTAECFVADPYADRPGSRMYRTGDLARWTVDGVLDFVGRADDQVKVRGFRIEPGEIEAALVALESVAQAAVVARRTGRGDVELVGYIVPTGEPPEPAMLQRALAERLPAYMVPAAFVTLEALPRTASGKLDRRRLPAPDRQGGVFRAPASPDERAVCDAFAEVLGVPRVGLDDDFFQLGGHSLLATRIVNRIRARLGLELSIRALFERPTPGRLCTEIARLRADEIEDFTL